VPFLKADTKIFAMGSCFALELRTALMNAGCQVFPEYRTIGYDKSRQIFDRIPERYALSYFDTFNMLQELEAALGLWTDRAESFCEVRGCAVNAMLKSDVVYQDPLRKMVYATSVELLGELSARIDAAVREGMEAADVFVLTLGLTEVWQHKRTGRWLCMAPESGLGGGGDIADFKASSFDENRANLHAIVKLLRSRYPGKHIVLSVSPVHLEATSTALDVGTASMESKCILRAVAGEVARAYDNVIYFPSFEMAQFWKMPVYLEDGRHVTRDFARRVVAAFMGSFAADAGPANGHYVVDAATLVRADTAVAPWSVARTT
jgi:hypothetical protein